MTGTESTARVPGVPRQGRGRAPAGGALVRRCGESPRACLLALAVTSALAGFAGTAAAADPVLPLGLQFVPPGLGPGTPASSAAAASRPSILDSLASIEAGPAEQPRAVRPAGDARASSGGAGQLAQFSGRRRQTPSLGRISAPLPARPLVSDPARGETVLSRSRPDYDPLGLPIGAFMAFPSLRVEEQLTDNVYRSDGDEAADLITTIRPQLSVESNWSNHSLIFDIAGAIGLFADNGSEDFEDVTVGAEGRLDIDRDTTIDADVGFAALHELRGSPDDVMGREPTEYNLETAGAEVKRRFGRFGAELEGKVESYNYIDADALVGGTLVEINNDDRDRKIFSGAARLGYQFLPETLAFVRGTVNRRAYKDDFDDTGVNRDSSGLGVEAGMEVDLGGLVFGELFGGYRTQDYEDSLLTDNDGFNFGLDLTWNVTPLTTIVATASRSIEETTLLGSSGEFRSQGKLSVNHELLRNLLILVDGSYVRSDYEGIDRRDDVVNAGAEARYSVSRNVFMSGAYRFSMRDSDGGADYTENVGLVTLGLQY